MTNEELRDHVMERLAPLPLSVRGMFGGLGLYLEDAFFGMISDGRLYFRTDDDSRPDYLAQGMGALQPRWRPRGPKTIDRNSEVPVSVLRDPETLRAWALRAATARR
jgi:DNA transformation protein